MRIKIKTLIFSILTPSLMVSGCASINQGINQSYEQLVSLTDTLSDDSQPTEPSSNQDAAAPELTDAEVTQSEMDQRPEQRYQVVSNEFVGPIYYDNLWDRVRNNLQLERDIAQPRVIAQINWYKKHPTYFKRISDRASRYMYHVVTELERRDLPAELALLPIVESAYDPFAYSHGRASGLWQFIPSTGRHFNLKQDWWYDGRRDIVASTDAALDYLSQLNNRFDDWLLALAAYNAGGGNVSKAIRKNTRKNKPTDFWSLHLPRETSAYSPKMVALAELLANPEKYNFEWPHVPNQPYFKEIQIDGQIDLAQAAELADIEIDELYKLNPAFNQWATHPDGPHRLLVPVENSDIFETNLASLDKKHRVNWKRYKIRSGDSLITIAKQFRTTPQVLREVNSIRKNMIRAGDTLLIPTSSRNMDEYTMSAIQRLHKRQNRAPNGGRHKSNYFVRSGDSFWTISRKFGVGVRELAKWNSMAPTDPLKINQKLVIWTKKPQVSKNGNKVIRKVGYKVRKGDSLARIASKFSVSVGDIKRWNPNAATKYIHPGQSITLYVDVTNIN
ncbi:lytic transglycosylase [Litoribrevibacter albus]|uniref:Lytic transglycosylase n=1 Tax=Litoribrevibacter albus TaxID=1473156 RepID=A0AA37W8A1_9GAMM|nr:LysM peptidoglycan-binding domain-containing protein [Litoribrevibacter albus]GLQ32248.1 lytic transglycosylase [Litoribrevibacter albus]